MALVRLRLTPHGPRELRQLPSVRADLERRAKAIAAAAGPGNEVSSMIGATRARASVVTATTEARRAEATTRALTRALEAGK